MSAEQIARAACEEGRQVLTEPESKRILQETGIPVLEAREADSPEEAVRIAQEVGFPVALKVCSPKVIHKSDVQGVKLDLWGEEAVRRAFEEIRCAAAPYDPQARVSVQPMAPPGGLELVVGTSTDIQFGPVIMFGLGGVFVEVLRDVTFRIIPIEEVDAWEMIQEVQAGALLNGWRGRPPVNKEAVVRLLLQVSQLVEQRSWIQEMDLNPVFAYSEGVLVADARIVISAAELQK